MLSGKVVQASFTSAVDTVRAVDADGEVVTAEVASDGGFQLTLPAGDDHMLSLLSGEVSAAGLRRASARLPAPRAATALGNIIVQATTQRCGRGSTHWRSMGALNHFEALDWDEDEVSRTA